MLYCRYCHRVPTDRLTASVSKTEVLIMLLSNYTLSLSIVSGVRWKQFCGSVPAVLVDGLFCSSGNGHDERQHV